MRRMQAEARRAAMTRALGRNGLSFALMHRGMTIALAAAFGVHRTTAWRDLKRIVGSGTEYNFHGPDDELLFTVSCAYRGGPVMSITDADGYEIRGAERQFALGQMRRFRR